MMFFINRMYRKRYAALLGMAVLALALAFLQPYVSFASEVGSDMMFDLWKYKTDGEDTGLLTGKPSQPKPAEPASVTAIVSGTVCFRQPMALLPNDVVEIQLLDVSRQDAAAFVIAKKKFTPQEHVPIPFNITYEPATLNPLHRYAIQARILRNGQPVFMNSAANFVITHGYPNQTNVLVEMVNNQPAAEAGGHERLPQTFPAPDTYLGTYKRKFTSASGMVEKTICIREDKSVEVKSQYPQGTVWEAGTWTYQVHQLVVTLTHKNGENIQPEHIVFELREDKLVAVDYDRRVHGRDYAFTRDSIAQQGN
jgi:putative lipoprotein